MKKLLTALSLTLLLASCESISGAKSSSGISATNDSATTVISTYNGGEVTLRSATLELEKLVARDEKLKGLTFDKLSADQKETIVKEVVFKEIAYKEAKKKKT
jgi:hypothetical protein